MPARGQGALLVLRVLHAAPGVRGVGLVVWGLSVILVNWKLTFHLLMDQA